MNPVNAGWPSLESSQASLLSALTRSYERIFIELPGWFMDPGNRFFWAYLLSFAVVGAWAYRRYYPEARTHVIQFLFPREMYTHPSAILDYKLLLMNRLLGPAALLSRLVLGTGLITLVATGTQEALTQLLGGHHQSLNWSLLSSTLLVIAITMLRDFETYVTHGLSHKVPLLWEFHKVHHSAEVLTPFTVYRKHPVYNLFGQLMTLMLVAPMQGVVAYLFVGEAQPLTIFGANLVFSVFHFLGANLRHSHIWLSFGPVWGRILISPAQHQIHHSKAELHWNKNFGEVFALWDWLFGTLYLPGKTREVIEFGVAGADRQEHATLLQAYFVPFINCGRIIRGYFGAKPLVPDATSR
jgi:sterol desaturase/sphingolipid hydroxylase (fatty acid hydroxylase superfamily)